MVASALFSNSVILSNSPIVLSSVSIVLKNNWRSLAALICSSPCPKSSNFNVIDDISLSFSIGSFIDWIMIKPLYIISNLIVWSSSIVSIATILINLCISDTSIEYSRKLGNVRGRTLSYFPISFSASFIKRALFFISINKCAIIATFNFS